MWVCILFLLIICIIYYPFLLTLIHNYQQNVKLRILKQDSFEKAECEEEREWTDVRNENFLNSVTELCTLDLPDNKIIDHLFMIINSGRKLNINVSKQVYDLLVFVLDEKYKPFLDGFKYFTLYGFNMNHKRKLVDILDKMEYDFLY